MALVAALVAAVLVAVAVVPPAITMTKMTIPGVCSSAIQTGYVGRHSPHIANQPSLLLDRSQTHRYSEAPIRTCMIFLDHVQNVQIHAVRAI